MVVSAFAAEQFPGGAGSSIAGMVLTALAAWPVAAEFGCGGLTVGLMLAGVASAVAAVATVSIPDDVTRRA